MRPEDTAMAGGDDYGWEEEAKRYCCNSDYWRERAEKAEAALANMRGEIKFLSHELDGVLTDTLRGDFDSVCRITVQRVHDKLSILAAAIEGMGLP